MGEIDELKAKLAECHKQMDELEDALSRTVAERYAATARAEAAEQRSDAAEALVRAMEHASPDPSPPETAPNPAAG